MPQFDPSVFVPQLVWLTISFVLLYVLLSVLVLPRINNVLQERKRTIDENLSLAKTAHESATKEAENYKMSYEKARENAMSIIQKTQVEMKSKIAKEESELMETIREEAKKSDVRLMALRKESMAEVDKIVETVVYGIGSLFGDKKFAEADVKKAIHDEILLREQSLENQGL